MAALTRGAKAPEIELPLLQGGRFSLHEALTKGPVVLCFFKISCPVCQYAFPYYERLAQRLKSQSVSVIGVSQDDPSSTRQFVADYGITFPMAMDAKGYVVSSAYGLTNVPTVFEVGQEGTIVESIVGWSKPEVEEIYGRQSPQDAPPPLFRADEVISDFRPG